MLMSRVTYVLVVITLLGNGVYTHSSLQTEEVSGFRDTYSQRKQTLDAVKLLDRELELLSNINHRCGQLTFGCKKWKLDEYVLILRELSKYYATYNTEERQLSINAKYMLLSSLVKRAFKEMGFVGFYSVQGYSGTERLEIAPYASSIFATPIIMRGKGVCGETWHRGATMLIPDVTKHPNYIACDEFTLSEIVVTYYDLQGAVKAVLDIDAEMRDYFDPTDQICLEEITKMLNF